MHLYSCSCSCPGATPQPRLGPASSTLGTYRAQSSDPMPAYTSKCLNAIWHLWTWRGYPQTPSQTPEHTSHAILPEELPHGTLLHPPQREHPRPEHDHGRAIVRSRCADFMNFVLFQSKNAFSPAWMTLSTARLIPAVASSIKHGFSDAGHARGREVEASVKTGRLDSGKHLLHAQGVLTQCHSCPQRRSYDPMLAQGRSHHESLLPGTQGTRTIADSYLAAVLRWSILRTPYLHT